MTKTVLRSRVGSDGILQLKLPCGETSANEEVEITVEPIKKKTRMTTEERKAWVEKMAGSLSDIDFKRHPQGELETRDPL